MTIENASKLGLARTSLQLSSFILSRSEKEINDQYQDQLHLSQNLTTSTNYRITQRRNQRKRMRLLPKTWTRGKFLGAASTGRVATSGNIIIIRHSDASNVNLIGSAMIEDLVAEDAIIVHKTLSAPLLGAAKKKLSVKDAAAVKIQATFRGHLARRAFQALKSLVKLQALARGASVRRQSSFAFHCMHAMVRLQVRVRARQLLLVNPSHQLIKKHP